jgi:FKBP-type peptidyl-prolyl cis-trans isomerase
MNTITFFPFHLLQGCQTEANYQSSLYHKDNTNRQNPNLHIYQWEHIEFDEEEIDIFDNGINKFRLEEGDNKTFPERNSTVTIQYTLRDKETNQIIYSTFSQKERCNQYYTFTLGREEVIKGLEFSIQKMSLGENSILIIPKKLAKGKINNISIPNNTDIKIHVILVDIK